MKIQSITTIVAVLVLGTLGLQAKDKGAQPGKGGTDYDAEAVVKKFDKNSDGKLSLEEYSSMKKFAKEKDPAAAAKQEFTATDTDKDGNVTAAELKAKHEKKMAKGGDAAKPAAKPEPKPEPAK
ncbi:MAG: hypothetical protein JWO94_3408 [Verrucomicrobiaceae bacterium]|nr:hypothetical protein [Verrucomicrobiaceae bacterium]